MNRLEQVNQQFPATKMFVSPETLTLDGTVFPEVTDNHHSRGVKTDYYNT
jgi:hypothetical protein